ncbi:lipoate--protein ligase [Thiotrichales bacterium 19S9-12]|nr:lipoate--protein ligase [Thiotrichales bacterium 19S9-11]MCF6811837.1 lipoate--protein ligase [Thiotrichales bacterium 19S9-12]
MNTATVFLQNLTDPFYNLAVEKYLYTHIATKEPMLYLWRNMPCVVIGRAQNPWLECNLPFMDQKQIPMIRRHSGGGTVFHDLNNLNFSFISPPDYYDKKRQIQIIINALKALGITTTTSERNDILLPHSGHHYKISGSAYRESRKVSLHHATLLVGGNVDLLNQCIHSHEDNINAKGVKSVRSKVLTLQHLQPDLTVDRVIGAIIDSFQQQYNHTNQVEINDYNQFGEFNHEIKAEAERLKDWQWRFGKTLPFEKTFSINNHQYTVVVKNGLIEQITNANNQTITPTSEIPFTNQSDQIEGLLST